jgi:hypothetical protein
MSMSDITERDTLRMHLKGTDPSYRTNATGYIAALSLASPDESDPLASELTYTPYARVPFTKSSDWTEATVSSFVNAVIKQFPKRTDAGATQTMRSFAVVDTASGAVTQCIIGTLDEEIAINQNGQPTFNVGDLEITAQ